MLKTQNMVRKYAQFLYRGSKVMPNALDWCPVARTLEIIGGKWTPLIMFYLKDEPRRFNALRRLIPEISQRMLTLQLRALEEHGVVARKVFATVPPHVEYSLTGRGRSLGPIIEAMEAWGSNDLTPSQIANDRRYPRDL